MLADHASIEQAHLARMENGLVDPGVVILEKIADALEIPTKNLFD